MMVLVFKANLRSNIIYNKPSLQPYLGVVMISVFIQN